MSEAELLIALARAKAQRARLTPYTEAWAEAGYEVARLSEAIRKVRANAKR